MGKGKRARQKTTTIVDIARHAGVSASTVSRALTGNIPVAPETQAAIQKAIQQLGYRPNHYARGLVTGNSMIVGVVTQDIASTFFGMLLEGVELGFDGSGYSPLIMPGSWNVDKELRALDTLMGRQVDGLIILSGGIPDERIVEIAEEVPIILVGRDVPEIHDWCVQVDNFQGAYSATRHLINLGHQRIVHVTGSMKQQDAVSRYNGYRQALIDAGLEADPRLVVEANFAQQGGILAVETLLTRGTMFTAIFAGSDQIASGCQLGLYRHGLRVPADVSLVGFDDEPGSAYTLPPLTTIRQPTYDMGFAAAKGILALLNHEELSFPPLTTQLIIRESTARLVSS